jgi:hypothetical protein
VVAVPEPLFFEATDETNGRELVVTAAEDGYGCVAVYGPGCCTSRYRVDLPPVEVAQLALALAAHAHDALGVDELRERL